MKQKKRNKQYLREKEYRKLLEKQNDFFSSVRKKEYYEIDPIHDGYERSFCIKEKFYNSEKYDYLRDFLDNFQITTWCRNKDFKFKNLKGEIIEDFPSFKIFTPRQFESVDEAYKDCFILIKEWNQYSKKYYPYYVVNESTKSYFRLKRYKSFITHRYDIDSFAKSEYDKATELLYTRYIDLYYRHRDGGWKEINKRIKRAKTRNYLSDCMKGDFYGKTFNKLAYGNRKYDTY